LILPESASQSRNPRKVLRFVLSTKELLDHHLQKYDCPPHIRTAALARTNQGILRCAYEAGDLPTATLAFNEYRSLGLPWKLEPRLYYFGSRSPWHRRVARPVISAFDFVGRALRKLSRLLKVG
jgi:hypothetical protein